jgi:hypothetical protein
MMSSINQNFILFPHPGYLSLFLYKRKGDTKILAWASNALPLVRETNFAIFVSLFCVQIINRLCQLILHACMKHESVGRSMH